jgi:TPR repeat protein
MRNVLILALIMVLSGCHSQLNLEQGIQSFQHQDYRQAFIRLRPAAEHGIPEAQYAVGYMYYYGQGVVENRQKAWFWISAAAEHGQVDAQKAVAILKKNHGVLD